MLSKHDQAVLAATEDQLVEEDPRWAAQFGPAGPTSRAGRWPWWAAIAGAIAMVVLTALGLFGNGLLVLAVAAAPLARRLWPRFRQAWQARDHGGSEPTPGLL